MTPLRIDFAPRTVRRAVARTGPLTWLLGCAGLTLCIVAALMIAALMKKNSVREASLQHARAQLSERTRHRAPPRKFMIPAAQALAINAAILQLNLPWSDVLDAIEGATPATVALLALEPDAKKHTIKGTAEAKSSDQMIAYIEQLKKQAFFGEVVLTRHEINEQDANKPLRFQFEAQWKEAMP
jgi:Tfp pilus assembly protein PilN